MMSTYELADVDETRAFGATSNALEFLAVVDTVLATADVTLAHETNEDLLVRSVDAVSIALSDFDLYGDEEDFFLDGFGATQVAAGIWTALRRERDALNEVTAVAA
jgi:hypothetical protein